MERACTGGQHGTCSAELWKEFPWRTVGPAHHAVPLGKPNCPSADQVVHPSDLGKLTGVTPVVSGTSISYTTSNVSPSNHHFIPLGSTTETRADDGYMCLVVLPAYDCQPGSLRHPLIVSPNVTFTGVRALNLDQHLILILRWSDGNRGSVSKSACPAAHFPHTEYISVVG